MEFRMAGRLRHSSVNGPGIRYVLFFQGCPHGCRDCQNPETWARLGGHASDTEAAVADILATRYLDGVTLSGGDPLFQPEAARLIASACRRAHLNVWVYTGWTYEAILEGRAGTADTVLPCVDVLVDGPFLPEKKDGRALWRGSSNQRLIDVPASLDAGRVILWTPEKGLFL